MARETHGLIPGIPFEGPPLPDLADVPMTCATCGTFLREYAYAQAGLPGLYCSSVCLAAAAKPREED